MLYERLIPDIHLNSRERTLTALQVDPVPIAARGTSACFVEMPHLLCRTAVRPLAALLDQMLSEGATAAANDRYPGILQVRCRTR